MTESRYCIYTSPLIVPITAKPIVDGAVVVDNHCIVEVGERDRLLAKWPRAKTVELSGVLIPPLINCHMHLELAAFDDMPRPGEGEPMTVWIATLIERRTGAEDAATTAARVEKARLEQHHSGVALIGDISNSSVGVGAGGESLPEIYRFYEILAPTTVRTDEALGLLESISTRIPACAHAPYSTAAELIVALKNRARENGHVFSLHVAESIAEIQFLQSGLGPFRDFLDQRRSWDGTIFGGGRFDGSIFYLDSLGVLDDRTLCVHCLHVSESEITLLAKRRAKVCLCPGSNDFLRVGHAPLKKMLDAGLLPAIGTDSPASNEGGDLWREIGILRHLHPDVPASTLLAMATYGGAAALGRTQDYGSLERGKKPLMLEVDVEVDNSATALEVLECLVCGRRPQNIRWRTPLPRR